MPIIGDKIHSRDLGFKGTLSWYIWAQCIDCGKQSWVRAIEIKNRPWVCAECSRKKSNLHKTTLKVFQLGLQECKKCHRILPADLKHFHKVSKSTLGITNICKDCSRIEYQNECNRLGKAEIVCSLCGRTELVWNTGNHKDICGGCSQKLSGKQSLPRGNYDIIYKPKSESHCKICGNVYPTTIKYWKRGHNKSGFNLRRCRKCLNRIRNTNLQAKIHRRISNYIRQSLNGNKGYRSWESLVGYTVKDLIKHLQKQFTDGMTWGNYGKWHIDHTIPQSAFHYTTPDDIDFKRCWALSNLQPLWSEDNVAKGAQILTFFQPSLKLENKNTKGIH